MKKHALTILLGALLLAACKPTITSTPVTSSPTKIPTAISKQILTSTPPPQGNTIIVTSAADIGLGTLRQALLDAQPYDTITFDTDTFLPDNPVTISVESELPHIEKSHLTLDASDAGVILDGTKIKDNWVAGLQIVSSESNTIMGLQISNFPGPGIAISSDAMHYARLNRIGGDRSQGAGPFGQGNLFSHNAHGIDVSTSNTYLNFITGNLIGTDATGMVALGNQAGIWITEGAHDNVIGPNNIIAYNSGSGVVIQYADTLRNTITRNSIYEQPYRNILLEASSNAHLTAPVIFDYDVVKGTVKGATCPHCKIEIFSDSSGGGKIYEARMTADYEGVFTFKKMNSFIGPNLTATTTDLDGNTSEFSLPTFGARGSLVLQQDNNLPRTQFTTRESRGLADNRIGGGFDNWATPEFYDLGLYGLGVTRVRVGIAGQEPELVNWDIPEFSIVSNHDEVFTRMADNGLTITYGLTFWDKLTYPGGKGAPCTRFKMEGEIERYLEFVKFIVHHFKDRVQYYELWNEPDIANYCPKSIEVADYINLVERTVPVIRQEYPEAKIVVGAISSLSSPKAYNYLWDILKSDIMPLVDVISWHPMYGTSPEYEKDYYYGYPAMVQQIKDTAAANGFVGEYHADELTWFTPPDKRWEYSPIVATKYFGRGALMNLGMDVAVSIGGSDYHLLLPKLCTVMEGAKPVNFPIQIKSSAENIVSYTFSLPDNHSYLIALWTDGKAAENDAGVEASLLFPGFSGGEAIGFDVLYGLEQELIIERENGHLVIHNLLVKDYPIIIKLTNAGP